MLGASRPDPATRAVGGAPAPEARARRLRPWAPASPSSPATARRRRSLEEARSGPRSGGPDDRLRAPVRDVQAGRAALQRHRPAGPPAVGRRDRPIQIVFAGKAHPADRPGQKVIQEIFQRSPLARAPRTRLHPRGLRHPGRPLPRPGRRRLAQQPAPAARGVRDVRHEGGRKRRRRTSASSTAGGTRAATGDNGWAIGGREQDPDEATQDWADAKDLYRLLEEDARPGLLRARRDRAPGRLDRPRCAGPWPASIWQFSTTRMLHEYTERLYLPAAGIGPPPAGPADDASPAAEAS